METSKYWKRRKTEQTVELNFRCQSTLDCQSTLGPSSSLAEKLLSLENELSSKLAELKFGHPVAHIYNPLIYAAETHANFVRKYVINRKKLIFLGMNPGPFGMVQSGVPFGEISIVRDWLKIEGRVGQPDNPHPKRPVTGLACRRSEVSGVRFWGLLKEIAEQPDNFFKYCYVHNYCPLAFLSQSGKNITPADFKKDSLTPLENLCDDYLIKVLKLLDVEIVVGLGKFAYEKCLKAQKKYSDLIPSLRIERILHPSPMNPATNVNGGWKMIALKELENLNLLNVISGKY